ncbi:cutinase family protein [Gordonia sp. NPDC003950]
MAGFGDRRRIRLAALTVGVGAVAASLVTATFLGRGVALADDSPYTCTGPGAVFVVGGTWNPDSYLLGINQRYGAQGYEIVQVPYSATIWPLGSVGYNASEAEGAANLERAVADYQQACDADGTKKVAIVGYSQGARIAGDVLTDIGQNRPLEDGTVIDSSRVTGELYSDPRMVGTLWGQGIESALVGVIPGLTMSGPRSGTDYGGLPVTTYCIEGDPICDLPDVLHDPIGVVDDFFGYWVKHNQYPYHMYQYPGDYVIWDLGPVDGEMTCTQTGTLENVQTCTISSPSSSAIIVQNLVDALGLDWSVPDLLPYRFRFPDIIGITLSDFQVPIRWVMDWLPPLPELGYGAYLPNLFDFQDTLNGVLQWDSALFKQGVVALAASATSIVLLPVNFVRYWAERIVEGITTVPWGPDSSSQSTAALSSSPVAAMSYGVSALSAGETEDEAQGSGDAQTDGTKGSLDGGDTSAPGEVVPDSPATPVTTGETTPPTTPEPTGSATSPATPEPTGSATPPATPEPTADPTPSVTPSPTPETTGSAGAVPTADAAAVDASKEPVGVG